MKTKTYRTSQSVDFVIVGSGAAGGVLARELARARLDVVVLEQGPRLYPADFQHDELKNWFIGGLVANPQSNPQSFRRSASETAAVPLVRTPLWYARGVGGSTLHYTANYWRFREIDFRERSALGEISGTGFADWPITYAELEPYYTKVDWEIGVSGQAGLDPGDSPRSRPYPMPPVTREIFGRVVRARRAQARVAARAGAAGHQLGALWRTSRLRALRLLPRLRLRSDGQGVVRMRRSFRRRKPRAIARCVPTATYRASKPTSAAA